MKRLLCVLSSVNAGGAETFLMKLYRKLDREKYQMDFCINAPEKNHYEDEILSMGGKIFRIPAKSENMKGFRDGLARVVRENGYGYVLRITSSAMGFLDLKIAKQAGAKICSVRSSNSSDGGSVKALLAHRLGRLLFSKYVDVRFAPSDLAARYTFGDRAYETGKVSILHNAIDLTVFRYSDSGRQAVRAEYGIAEGDTVYGHVGRFMDQKNHTFLMDIFAALRRENPKAKLLLIGKGELEGVLREKAAQLGLQDAVIFGGVRSDIPQVLSAMDVFVFPSLYEGMPNTVIEAQATGLPCVIADTITKEADITGLVTYLPLGDAERWAKEACAKGSESRMDTREQFVQQGYDIESQVGLFTKLVFGE